jgi:hypothetical protein
MSWMNDGKLRKKKARQGLYKLEDEGGNLEGAKDAFIKRGGKIDKIESSEAKEILSKVNSKYNY